MKSIKTRKVIKTRRIVSGWVLFASALLSGGVFAQQTIKIGYAVSRDSHYGAKADAFCHALETRTSRRFVCSHAPNATLGNDREMIEAAQIGALEVTVVASGAVGNFVPEVRVLDIPFLFRDEGHARKTLDGDVGTTLLAAFPSRGLIGMAWGENGFRHITTTRREVNSPQDLAGMKLRTMENRVHVDSFRALGALPTPMAWPEVYPALQQGTIDGQENPLSILVTAKIWQVQKHLALTGHVYSPTVMIASPALWARLSAQDRDTFLAAAVAGVQAQRARVDQENRQAIALLEKEGMRVTRPDTSVFRDALASNFARYQQTYGAVLAAIQAVR